MNQERLYTQLRDLHLYRNYESSEKDINLKTFIRIVNIFPNDAFYLVDCKQATVHRLSSNFNRLVGDDSEQVSELFPLFDHVHDQQIEKFAAFTSKLLNRSFSDPNHWNSFEDCTKLRYKAKTGKTIIKTTTSAMKDANGCIRYTLGKLTDISAFTDSCDIKYQFCGPHEKKHFAFFNNLNEFSEILGKRELEILTHIGKGYSSKMISEILSISKHTVDTHRRNIIMKLEVTGCIQAYNKAKDMGLF